MTKRLAEELDTVDALIPPALRDARVNTLQSLTLMPDCMLNPGASGGVLMCGDVVNLIRQRLTAPMLCSRTALTVHAWSWEVGLQWVAYDFNTGWSAPRACGHDNGDTLLFTVEGRACSRWIDKYDRFCVIPLDGSVPLWSAPTPFDGSEDLLSQPVDTAVFFFLHDYTSIVRCGAGASDPGPQESLPDSLHESYTARVCGDRVLFDRSITTAPSFVWFSVAQYDLHAHAVSFEKDDIKCDRSNANFGEEGNGTVTHIDCNSVLLTSIAGCYAYDIRSDATRGLKCPTFRRPDTSYDVQIFDEYLWCLTTYDGIVFEYDARCDYWRQPHAACKKHVYHPAIQWRELSP